MIKIRRDNRVIFWLLIGGLVLNILWSFRLELQAKTTQTLVEKYHFNLNQGADTLTGLKEYFRRADEISIKTNDGNMSIEMTPALHQLTIGVGKETIIIGKLDTASDQLGNGILLSTAGAGGPTYMLQTSKGIHLSFGNVSEPFHFNMSRDKELMEIRQRGSFIQVGKAPVGDSIYQGVFMGEKNFATLGINKDEGIGLRSLKQIYLSVAKMSEDSEPFHFNMSRDKELMEIRHRGSFIQVGEAPVGDSIYQGVFMGEKNFATLGINKDEGIGLRSLKQIYLSVAKMSEDSEPFHFNMSRDKELMEIRHRGSFIQVGEAPVGDSIYQGVFMGEKNFATLGINKDEGIGLRTKKKIILNAENELIIEAKGDIDIKSKNGVVKINGKKIHMNK